MELRENVYFNIAVLVIVDATSNLKVFPNYSLFPNYSCLDS